MNRWLLVTLIVILSAVFCSILSERMVTSDLLRAIKAERETNRSISLDISEVMQKHIVVRTEKEFIHEQLVRRNAFGRISRI